MGMNAHQEATLSTLYDLIETCRDGQEGFRKASECIIDQPELKMLLASFSLQRGKFAKELEAHVRALGGDVPAEGSSVGGHLHRWWMDLETALLPEDNHRILAECERGENTAHEVYRRALEDINTLPDSVRGLALWQEREISGVHDTVRALRDASPSAMPEILASAHETYQAKDVVGNIVGAASSTAAQAESFIRRNPLPILALALGTGALIGMIFYALELRNERLRVELDGRPLRRLGRGAQSTIEGLRDRAQSGIGILQDRMQDLQGGPRRRKNRFLRGFRNTFDRLFGKG